MIQPTHASCVINRICSLRPGPWLHDGGAA
jgi:hypothetical protein